MEYYVVGGCRYAKNFKWISQPLSSSPHGGIFKNVKFYQDYANHQKQQWKEKQEYYQKNFNNWDDYFQGFYGFKDEEKPKDSNYPYNVFGLKKSASHDDVKKAYRKSILKAHPDKGGSNELFRKIQEAWEYFTNFIK